ncbi:unnamed protein product [Brachionus calyciflorus]|uniref:Retrotransposon gag domain-containing protein n=1 Tax=Brachionus calyciflorus TaxID=104777 RepID=A0A813T5T1_9BILA|nr:unnamed protein product [Brachionus calyciflorus]
MDTRVNKEEKPDDLSELFKNRSNNGVMKLKDYIIEPVWDYVSLMSITVKFSLIGAALSIKQLIQSRVESPVNCDRFVDKRETVAAIYELCELKRGKHESVEKYFSRFSEAAKRADINGEDT